MKTHELMGFLAERQKQGFRPIRAIRPEVDGTFARIIEKCLAFDPRKRPASAAEVRQVLRRSLGLCASVTRWIVRHPKSVAAACLLAVGLGTAGAVHLATRPPEQVAQSQRGKAAFEKRDHELALHHFNESLRADPAQADILFARGRTYLKLATGDPKLYGIASADFIEADKLAPAPRNQAFIGYCLHQLASPPKAVIHVYEQALKGGINTAQIHANLAELHGAQGSPEELEKAQQHLDLALQMDPTLQLAHYVQLVVSYQKSLKPKLTPAEREIYLSKGIAHFRKALELGPMTGKMTMLGARVCASAARFDKSWTAPALEYLGKAMDQGISLNPKDPSFVALKDTDAYRALLLRTPPPNHASVASIRAVEPLTE
jgi:tetratricopeptide (TPR) repeat protein